MSGRIFAGDDKAYFPDYGAWLYPGDSLPEPPEGVELPEIEDDDSRFAAPNSKEGRAAKARGKEIRDAEEATADPEPEALQEVTEAAPAEPVAPAETEEQ